MKFITYLPICGLLFSNFVYGQTKHIEIKSPKNSSVFKRTTIDFVSDQQKFGDSVVVRVWRQPVISDSGLADFRSLLPHDDIKASCKGGIAKFRLDEIKHPVYFAICVRGKDSSLNNATPYVETLSPLLVEPGDRLTIYQKKDRWVFTGLGGLRLQVVSKLDSIEQSLNRKYINIRNIRSKVKPDTPLALPSLPSHDFVFGFEQSVKSQIAIMDTILSVQLDSLKIFKKELSESDYSVLRSQIIARKWYLEILYLRNSWEQSAYFQRISTLSPQDKKILSADIQKYITFYQENIKSFKEKWTALQLNPNSSYFTDLLLINTKTEQIIVKGDSLNILNRLLTDYSGIVKDRAVTAYFVDYSIWGYGSNKIPNYVEMLHYCYSRVVIDNDCRAQLKEIIESENKTAYNFSLKDKDGKIHRLSDYRGKVVFMDFWYSGCGHCIEYYQNVLSNAESFFKPNTKVLFISVSIDRDKSKWQTSVNKKLYSSPNEINVLNLYTNGLGLEEETIRHYKILEYPRPMIIDQNGKLFFTDALKLRDEKILVQQIKNALDTN